MNKNVLLVFAIVGWVGVYFLGEAQLRDSARIRSVCKTATEGWRELRATKSLEKERTVEEILAEEKREAEQMAKQILAGNYRISAADVLRMIVEECRGH